MRGTPLLQRRLCDLGLSLDRSDFAPMLRALDRELADARIALRPRFYLSAEYGCIERSATIGLLFTDGFAVLRRVARRHGLRVRTGEDALRTLRHEVGHAFCYVHRLFASPRFRRLFGVHGSFFDTYPTVWKPGPADHARLRRGEIATLYGARHPDDDFAVSFQTYLRDPAGCRAPYAGKPLILEKLDYVAEAVVRHGRSTDSGPPVAPDEPLHDLAITLGDWLTTVRAGRNYQMLASGAVA